MSKQKAIIVDLDGTLANIDHRLHLLEVGADIDWHKFEDRCINDGVNWWCAELVKHFRREGRAVIFVTGRTEKVRGLTKHWLQDHGISYDELFMRPTGDQRLDCELKEEIYLKYIKDKYDVLFTIEDRNRVVSMWRRNGLVCLQPQDGDY